MERSSPKTSAAVDSGSLFSLSPVFPYFCLALAMSEPLELPEEAFLFLGFSISDPESSPFLSSFAAGLLDLDLLPDLELALGLPDFDLLRDFLVGLPDFDLAGLADFALVGLPDLDLLRDFSFGLPDLESEGLPDFSLAGLGLPDFSLLG